MNQVSPSLTRPPRRKLENADIQREPSSNELGQETQLTPPVYQGNNGKNQNLPKKPQTIPVSAEELKPIAGTKRGKKGAIYEKYADEIISLMLKGHVYQSQIIQLMAAAEAGVNLISKFEKATYSQPTDQRIYAFNALQQNIDKNLDKARRLNDVDVLSRIIIKDIINRNYTEITNFVSSIFFELREKLSKDELDLSTAEGQSRMNLMIEESSKTLSEYLRSSLLAVRDQIPSAVEKSRQKGFG